jgi:glutamine---fructose-6-phosphate transaminase (isomerizing)
MSSPAHESDMRREIEEIPGVVEHLLADGASETTAIAAAIRARDPRWISIVARGTSDHAGIYARYLLETHLRLPVSLAAPAVTTVYGVGPDWKDALVIAVSQSGQSPDVVGVAEAARNDGAMTIAVTNDRTSPLAKATDFVLPCDAGVEHSVAATKTYVAQLAALASLVARLAPESELAGAIRALPDGIASCLDAAEAWVDRGGSDPTRPTAVFAGADRALVASRGYNLATALEVALKLKETSRIFAEGYSTADLLHGPVILSAVDVPALVFRPDGPMGLSIDTAVERLRETGSDPWIVGGAELGRGGTYPSTKTADPERHLSLPLALPEALTPLAFVLPGQLLAEAVARRRGYAPDAPEGLAKVTRTL